MAPDCSDPEYGVDMIKDSSVKQFSMSGANFNAVAQVPTFAADRLPVRLNLHASVVIKSIDSSLVKLSKPCKLKTG